MKKDFNDSRFTTNSTKPSTKVVTVNLNFLSEKQLKEFLKMFDSREAYIKNYMPLKAIARGLFDIINNSEIKINHNSKLGRMFRAINDLQGILILDNIREWSNLVQENYDFYKTY